MNLKDVLETDVLPRVRKPSRYLGCEYHSVHKDRDAVELRVALAFPDLYDLAMGNLGLHILYAILNELPWCWAERAYAPAPDMEAALRARNLPLFAHESKDPLCNADLIGFSMQSELTCTSVLTMIDLAGIPLRAEGRADSHPLIFAGGPVMVNPEPLAPFMDFMVVGDGEDVIVEIAEGMRDMRGARRREKLDALAEIQGVYVPSLYPVEALPGGRIVPAQDAPRIVRRIVADLDRAKFPSRYIVPFTQHVHDRIGLEIMRGCSRGCRFCQAGVINRPVRERSLEHLDELMRASFENTGYEELSLLSLSSCDHSRIAALLDHSAAHARRVRAAVSLPSLRLDSFSMGLADRSAGVRRTGLTFAPEAASSRLRAAINKQIADEDLIALCVEAIKLGWRHVKCYFMIGLPGETDEDVEAIADLCLGTLKRCRAVAPGAQLHVGVSTFVPKPFTPLQWAEQIDYDEIIRRQGLLKKRFARAHGLKFGRHEPESTFVEGLIARGDRRTADVIEAAFRQGARLDTCSEYLDFNAWRKALAEIGCDAKQALRGRDLEERLPWDHIDVFVSKEWLKDEWRRAIALEPTPDCREGICSQCGMQAEFPELCDRLIEAAGSRGKDQSSQAEKPGRDYEEPEPVQRLRFRIGRTGAVRFLSNLEWMTAWARALRRARLALAYSQGFHAHPKVSFSTAPPVGEESEGDYMDIVLHQRAEPADALRRLQDVLPEGFSVFDANEVPLKTPSLMSIVAGYAYTIHTRADANALAGRIEDVLAAETLMVERKGKPKGRNRERPVTRVDIRPTIAELKLGGSDGSGVTIEFTAVAPDRNMAKPREIVAILGLDPGTTRVVKTATTFLESGA